MSRSPACYALVPAAGSGSRAGQAMPKQYVALAGQPLIAHTLAALQDLPELAAVAVVLAPDDTQFATLLPQFTGRVYRCGGASRAASVRAGLAALQADGAHDDDWVLVHDAARCLVRATWVRELIRQCEDDAVGGLLATPLADTLKHVELGRAVATADRSRYWQAQTPQMFRLGMLTQALDHAGHTVTDEASAIEALGHTPLMVRAPLENFKVTLPEDFDLAERLLRSRP
jgi:2-C-methyl-D-erythritol 4-phosphate cytidylyltransferase